MGLSRKPQQKSERQFTAEHSFRNITTYLFVVAATHFRLGRETISGYQPVSEATEGAKRMFELVQNATGGEIVPVCPHNLSSINDTKEFVFEGTALDSGEEIYVFKPIDDDDGVRSTHTRFTGCTDSKRGIRITHTVTITANGSMAPIFLILSGLTEQELSKEQCPSGIVLKKIKGLNYGASVDISNQDEGTIIFMRSERFQVTGESNEQIINDYYENEVFHPFMRAHSIWRQPIGR